MSAFPSLPLFTDAFLADTGHLSAQETGAYLLLLMMAWRLPECRLPDDDLKLSRWARVDNRTWQRIKPAIMEFWTFEDGFWTQKRLSKERSVVSKRADVARQNGLHGGRPKSLENNKADNPTGSSRVSQKKAPNPNPIEESSDTNVSSLTERVRKNPWPSDYREQVWAIYPKKDEKKDGMAALDAVHRADKIPFSVIVDGINRLAAHIEEPKFAPSLHRWLKKERWNDEMLPRAASQGPPGQPQRPTIKNPFVAQLVKNYRPEPSHDPSDDDLLAAPDARTYGPRFVDHGYQVQEPARGASRPLPPLLDLRVAGSDRP